MNMKKFVFLLTMILVAYGFAVYIAAGATGPLHSEELALEADSQLREGKDATQRVQRIVDKANDRINQTIEKACDKADDILEAFDEGELTEEEKGAKIEKLIARLQKKTNRIADRAKEKGLKFGVIVECRWIAIMIDGREVLIDPLVIIGT